MNATIGSKERMETRTTDPAKMTHDELVYWRGELQARISNRPRKSDGKAMGNRYRDLDAREKARLSDIEQRLGSV